MYDVSEKPVSYIVREDGKKFLLTLRLLMSYIYGAPSKARNANVVYIWTYVGNAETVSFYLLQGY